VQQAASWSAAPAAKASSTDEWEAELEEWKRRYGCPDAAPRVEAALADAAVADAAPTREALLAPDLTQRNPANAQRNTPAMDVASQPPVETSQDVPQFATNESMLNTDVGPNQMRQTNESTPGKQLADLAAADEKIPRPKTSDVLQSALQDTSGATPRKELDRDGAFDERSGASLRKEADLLDKARRETALAKAEEQSQELRQDLSGLQGGTFTGTGGTGGWELTAQQPLAPRPPSSSPPETGRPGGRYLEHTPQDIELATDGAMMRVKADGSWKSEYSETGLQKRDFFLDLRKQREKHKGRQATGPLWSHLASQAKNLANTLDLQELLESLKLFASVRLDDYELYMRLLGEVPHYVTQATASQLCELVRILARRRLRERNYVDMVAAHLLHKIRVTDDALPGRQLVKCANAFAFLECRSNPKFVEYFLRHIEHRMHDLDATLCCLVAPIFVDQYMNDALRRAYLGRCAETHAGFQCPLEDARNIACTELVLRKEHHSLVVSLPPHVMRYLDKVQRHAQFDKWGAVTIPSTVAPDGPKGSERAEMNLSLQLKASTAAGAGKQADVFSSDMHRDVSACLTHLGVDHENGVLAGPYLLDIVAQDMVTPSKRIVFEVNSPHHYYEGTQQLTADKRLRHRMINRLGHKLHHVNAEEWKKLTPAQKMTFLLKLQQAQQDENAKEEKLKSAASTARTPLPSLPLGSTTGSDPLRLKSISDLRQPIRIPVPPSQRVRQPLSAR
jgi:hypothetical protein